MPHSIPPGYGPQYAATVSALPLVICSRPFYQTPQLEVCGAAQWRRDVSLLDTGLPSAYPELRRHVLTICLAPLGCD